MFYRFLKGILPPFVFFLSLTLYSQSETDIQQYAKSLSWESIHFIESDSTRWAAFQADSPAEKLVMIGDEALPYLIENLSAPDKVVATHFVMMKMLQPIEAIRPVDSIAIHLNCDELIGWHYVYMGFHWEYFIDKGYSVTPEELQSFQDYWDLTLSGRSIYVGGNEDFIQTIKVRDKLLYPCGHVNENNSTGLESDMLKNLLGLPLNHKKIDKLFATLGGDSLHTIYLPIYEMGDSTTYRYVVYHFDGIEFSFFDDILRTIFLKPSFKGSLPKGITFKGSRKDLRDKIGELEVYEDGAYHYKYGKAIFKIEGEFEEETYSLEHVMIGLRD